MKPSPTMPLSINTKLGRLAKALMKQDECFNEALHLGEYLEKAVELVELIEEQNKKASPDFTTRDFETSTGECPWCCKKLKVRDNIVLHGRETVYCDFCKMDWVGRAKAEGK